MNREQLKDTLKQIRAGVICNSLYYFYVCEGYYIQTSRVNKETFSDEEKKEIKSTALSFFTGKPEEWKEIDLLINNIQDDQLKTIKILID